MTRPEAQMDERRIPIPKAAGSKPVWASNFYREHRRCAWIAEYFGPPNGIGPVTLVECACGAEADITDYETW